MAFALLVRLLWGKVVIITVQQPPGFSMKMSRGEKIPFFCFCCFVLNKGFAGYIFNLLHVKQILQRCSQSQSSSVVPAGRCRRGTLIDPDTAFERVSTHALPSYCLFPHII